MLQQQCQKVQKETVGRESDSHRLSNATNSQVPRCVDVNRFLSSQALRD